jgi:Trk K+ transport system NAD-binding subunit
MKSLGQILYEASVSLNELRNWPWDTLSHTERHIMEHSAQAVADEASRRIIDSKASIGDGITDDTQAIQAIYDKERHMSTYVERIAREASAKLVQKYGISEEQLTEQQLAEALAQAVICGDFVRYVNVATGEQTISYEPHREAKRLYLELKELRRRMRAVLDEE